MNDVRGPRWLLVAALGIVAGFAAIGSPAPAAEGARVLMVDNEPDLTNWHFDPAEVTVPAGSTVVWVNKGKEEHTVTSDPDSREKFDSGYKKSGTSWQRVFSRPGRFSYHCAPHPWMKGTVVVVAGATPAPTSAAARGADAVSSTTAAPAPAATSTTFPPSLAAPTTTAPAETATTAAADTTSTSRRRRRVGGAVGRSGLLREGSGGNLAGTLAVVLLPTLGGLALGAKLRRSSLPEESFAAQVVLVRYPPQIPARSSGELIPLRSIFARHLPVPVRVPGGRRPCGWPPAAGSRPGTGTGRPG